MSLKRRKGIAIVDTLKGILVVAGKSKKFSLPGGGADKMESRKRATIRELYEETNLKTKNIKYLFSSIGNKWHNHKGTLVRNYSKIFLIEAQGVPKPRNEIKYVNFYNDKSKLDLTNGTKNIINKYLKEYKLCQKLN